LVVDGACLTECTAQRAESRHDAVGIQKRVSGAIAEIRVSDDLSFIVDIPRVAAPAAQ
jgi:hypothetical protein